MAKFKIGDRVCVLVNTSFSNKGDVGIINEDDSTVPFVVFPGGNEWAVSENKLVLVTEGDVDINYEIF